MVWCLVSACIRIEMIDHKIGTFLVSSTFTQVLCNFKIFVLYFSTSIFRNFILQYICKQL